MFDQEKSIQDQEALEILKSVIEYLDDTNDEASALNKLEVSVFAEKAGEIIFNGLNGIKNELLSLAQTHKLNALTNNLKLSMRAAPRHSSVY